MSNTHLRLVTLDCQHAFLNIDRDRLREIVHPHLLALGLPADTTITSCWWNKDQGLMVELFHPQLNPPDADACLQGTLPILVPPTCQKSSNTQD